MISPKFLFFKFDGNEITDGSAGAGIPVLGAGVAAGGAATVGLGASVAAASFSKGFGSEASGSFNGNAGLTSVAAVVTDAAGAAPNVNEVFAPSVFAGSAAVVVVVVAGAPKLNEGFDASVAPNRGLAAGAAAGWVPAVKLVAGAVRVGTVTAALAGLAPKLNPVAVGWADGAAEDPNSGATDGADVAGIMAGVAPNPLNDGA
jgi:hypothetical protein